MWSRLRRRVLFVFHRRRFDQELAEEMEFHARMLEAEQERLGADPESALASAQRRMGNTVLAREDAREAWLIRWLDTLGQDVRYCVRTFARNPGFAGVAVLTLGLGIGATAAIFHLIDKVMLRMLPVQAPEELMVVRGQVSYPRYQQLRDRNDVFSGLVAAHTLRETTLDFEGQELGAGSVELVSGNYFELLGVSAARGRTLTPADDTAPESGPVAVISHRFWKRALASSPDVLGRTLMVRSGAPGGANTSGFETDAGTGRRDRVPLTIVGIAPAEFFGDSVGTAVDVWVPLTMQPALMPGRAWLTRQSASWLYLMGRRRAGVGEAQASASLTPLWRRIRLEELGSEVTGDQRANIAKQSLNVESGEKGFAALRREFSQPLLILMTVVALVLLIACLNVANLLLARATARQHEISMRLSLGASRRRLLRQLLTESLILAGLGGLAGLALAAALTRILVDMVAAEGHQATLAFGLDWRILAFTGGVSLASGILFGLAPAWRASRGLAQPLKDGARAVSGGRRRLVAKSLVAVQVAVSLLLVVAAGLFLRTLYNLKTQAVGYDPSGLVLLRVDPVGAGYRGDDIGRACLELNARLAALPGVQAATFSENGLFSGTESGTTVVIPGFTPSSDDDRLVRFDQAGPGYFTKVGIPLLLGRDLADSDAAGAPAVAVINETMAGFYFPGRSPLGQPVRLDNGTALQIVGVARDARDHGLRDRPRRRLYVSYLQPIDGITTANFEIRTAQPEAVLASVRAEVQRFNPRLQVISLKSLRALMDADIVSERLVAKLSGAFGVLAVLLAALGLYGLVSYSVAGRRYEIGIRMALGAQRRTIAAMVLGEVTLLVAVGAAAGLVAALVLTRYVSSLVYGLTPTDLATHAGAAVLLLAVGALAGYPPARRAARTDPLLALRCE